MAISAYAGSRLNRLARQRVNQIEKEYKGQSVKPVFADWLLVIDSEKGARLEIKYGIWERERKPNQKRERLETKFDYVTL